MKDNRFSLDSMPVLVGAVCISLILFLLNLGVGSDFSLDAYLYTGITNLSSPLDYFFSLAKGEIYDIQPVRDFFLYIDILGSQYFGFSFKIFTNIVYIFLLFYYIRKLTISLGLEGNTIIYFLIFNPILVHICGIDTSKKHILSALFMLMYLSEYLKNNCSNKPKLTILLLLSLFAQPINALVSFIVLIDTYLKKKPLRFPMILAGITCSVVLLNMYYYSFIFPDLASSSKYADSSLADKILGLGRYFYQLVLPVEMYYFYFKGAITNMVGVGIAVTMLFLIRKSLTSFYKWFVSILLLNSYIVINARQTQIFHQDTYLIMGIVGLSITLGLMVQKLKYRKLFIGGIISFYIISSILMLQNKQHYGLFISKAVADHPSCRNIYNATRYSFQKNKDDEFLKYGKRMLKGKCIYHATGDEAINQMMSTNIIYLTDELTVDKKLEILTKKKFTSEVEQLAISMLYIQKNDQSKFVNNLNIYLENFEPTMMKGRIHRDLRKYCLDNKHLDSCLRIQKWAEEL
jgi:hypothetical protein